MASVETSNLPPQLMAMQRQVEEYARGHGLDFYPTIFEYIDADQLNAIAAKGGFPVRYPHWRFGMEYEQLSKGYSYGLQKIYELVINNDPCYAYLLGSNGITDHKLVMAHVYGHCDFFKNNHWFSKTNRKMIDDMANHATRVRRYVERFGQAKVESLIDTFLSIEDLIDPHSVFMKREMPYVAPVHDEEGREREAERKQATRYPAKSYMDRYINPPDQMAADREESQKEEEKAKK